METPAWGFREEKEGEEVRGRRGERGGRLALRVLSLVPALVVDSGRLRAKVHAGEPLSASEHAAWYGSSSSSTGKRKRGRGGSSRRLLFLDVDVPVIFSDKFQQLFEFFVFLDRMVDIPVVQQRQVLTVFFSVLVQFLDKVVVPVLCNDRDMVRQCRKPCWRRSLQFIEGRRRPFVPQRQIPMVLPVQKTIETPQLQLVRWLMPLLCRSCHARCRSDRCSWFRHCRKLWRCRRCSSFAVVDVPVICSDKFPASPEVPQTCSSTRCSSSEEG